MLVVKFQALLVGLGFVSNESSDYVSVRRDSSSFINIVFLSLVSRVISLHTDCISSINVFDFTFFSGRRSDTLLNVTVKASVMSGSIRE